VGEGGRGGKGRDEKLISRFSRISERKGFFTPLLPLPDVKILVRTLLLL